MKYAQLIQFEELIFKSYIYTSVYKSVMLVMSMTISGHVVSLASGLVVLQQETGTEKLLKTCS